MARINREQLQKRVVQHYINVANKQKQITVIHFVQEKIPRQTIYIASLGSMKNQAMLVTSQDSLVQRSYPVDS